MTGVWHWVLSVTGINNETGKWYAFWSGFGANFGEVTLLAGVLAAWHRVNCHTKGCWRIGRQQVAGTTLVVCRKHHPDGKPTHEHILELHRAHMEAERLRHELLHSGSAVQSVSAVHSDSAVHSGSTGSPDSRPAGTQPR
jgi:hypothetical protein